MEIVNRQQNLRNSKQSRGAVDFPEGKEGSSRLGWIVLEAIAGVTISGYINVLKKK